MRILQGELVAMQEWVKTTGARVCVVFEGVDSAGKGGTIRRITERTSPRVFKHIALPAPDARVKSQMYVQRYVAHFPSAGEVVIFDRSWYNRAGVEPVMGYCTPEQTERFLEMVPQVEKAMVDDGIILIKYFLNVSREEQTRRLESRIDDPRKIWKLSPTDLKSYSRRYDYLRARDAMFVATELGVGAVAHRATTTTRSAAGSTSSPTCSARSPTSRSRRPDVEDAQAAEPRRVRRAGFVEAQHPDAVLETHGERTPATTGSEGKDLAMTETPVAPSGERCSRDRLVRPDAGGRRDAARRRPRRRASPRRGPPSCWQKNGPNALPAEATTPVWQQFLAQYRSYMQIILVAAAVASMLIGEISTGIVVLAITALNALGGMRQQGKAESAMNALAVDAEGVRAGSSRRGGGQDRRPTRWSSVTSSCSRRVTTCAPTGGSSRPRPCRSTSPG